MSAKHGSLLFFSFYFKRQAKTGYYFMIFRFSDQFQIVTQIERVLLLLSFELRKNSKFGFVAGPLRLSAIGNKKIYKTEGYTAPIEYIGDVYYVINLLRSRYRFSRCCSLFEAIGMLEFHSTSE